MSELQMTLTYEQVMKYDSKYVFKHTGTDEIYTKTRIKNLIKRFIKASERTNFNMTVDEYKEKFCSLLVPIQAYFERDGKRHHMSCEFGEDPQCCVCWCGGKYHNWRCATLEADGQ